MTRVVVTITVTEYPTRPAMSAFLFLSLVDACDEAVYRFRMWRLDRENRRLAARLAASALAKRADYEDYLYRHGDPRGIYGRYPPCITPRNTTPQRLERL